MLRACARRDQRGLLALVDESVAVSMGGGIYGKAGLVSDFLNSSSKGSGYARLQQLLRLGGTIRRDSAGRLTATYPYLQDEDRHSQLVRQLDFEPFVTFVGTTPDVVVHAAPSSRSPVVRRLAYPVLITPYDAVGRTDFWLPVTAADSSFQGYADARQLYCLADVTLTVEQKNGRLRITSVAPFDWRAGTG
ncbi:hypothetical protein DLM85_22125 [Hymenobacter edaphi]|uniref:Uncharacterized protein n=1 Tax=Hymenobacter edaphi TaxID=2211146 RepID=A0A328B7R7_9BACT|nr:hypothetical protein DLM85_22125 [Hymenobacter edaphi]